jgi:hypothetical protein
MNLAEHPISHILSEITIKRKKLNLRRQEGLGRILDLTGGKLRMKNERGLRISKLRLLFNELKSSQNSDLSNRKKFQNVKKQTCIISSRKIVETWVIIGNKVSNTSKKFTKKKEVYQ